MCHHKSFSEQPHERKASLTQMAHSVAEERFIQHQAVPFQSNLPM